MQEKISSFPWGIYVGDLIDENNSIPLCLDANQGGFCVLFDDSSESVVNNFVENVALKLLEVIPLGSIKVDIFNFGKNRFMHLSELSKANLCTVAYLPNKATSRFDAIEELALDRHHNLLSPDTPTLSEYNEANNVTEKYHLLLLNLDDFPDDMTSPKRIKNFFNSAFEAGFYTIAFGNQEVFESKSKATQTILNQFPQLLVTDNQFELTEELFEFTDLLEEFEFEHVNDNKNKIVKNILNAFDKEEENDTEQDFLHIPIGMIGREKLYFNMGLKSQNYHAFIAGMTGMGKTNLLNSIIVNIAKNYTAKEVELYLMDYKPAGAEFIIFKDHPNCKKLFLDNQDPAPALDILKEFKDEMYARGKVLNGKSIDEYNIKNPNSIIPRKILIIDEVQRMFSGGWKGENEFNELVEDIIKAGRSFGLHLILTTQALQQIKMKPTIMGQIPLKLSFRLDDSMEAMRVFKENKDAIHKVTKLKKYQFVYSDFNKTVEAQANYLDKDDIEKILTDVRASREVSEVLTPELFSVATVQEKKDEPLEVNNDRASYEPQYSTDSAKELLERIAKEQSDE